MKYLFALMFFIPISTIVNAQIVDIPDQGFKNYLLTEGVDLNGDGDIQNTEAESVITLDVNGPDIMSYEGIKSFINLEEFSAVSEFAETIDMSGMSKLKSFNVPEIGLGLSISLKNCIRLSTFSIGTALGSNSSLIDLSGCTSLTSFNLDNSGGLLVSELLLTDCSSLQELIITDGFGEYLLDVNGCTSLRKIDFTAVGSFGSFEFTNLPNLDTLIINGDIGIIEIAACPNLRVIDVKILQDFLLNDAPKLKSLSVHADILSDFVFKNLIELEVVNLEANVNGAISLSGCENLHTFNTWSIVHESLNLSGCRKLKVAPTFSGPMEFVNLTNCSAVSEIQVFNFVGHLICNGMTSLQSIWAHDQIGEQLDVDGCYNLNTITISRLNVSSLDLSSCIALKVLELNLESEIKSLILKNGGSETLQIDNIAGLDSLKHICADADEVDKYLTQFSALPNLIINDNCTFANTGRPYSASGAAYLDVNNDSCKTSQQKLPYGKFSMVGENGLDALFFADDNGDYQYYLPEGGYTYMPIVPYGMDLFTLIPQSVSIVHPDTIGNTLQDFCFINSQDLDIINITLIPISDARPGFDANYRITYTNSGNIIKDGEIEINFSGDVLDFEFANPSISSLEPGRLKWSFEGLLPFETRTIDLTFNLNSPMETPSLIDGSILNFKATITPIGNVSKTAHFSNLNQTVVNSFDPNDKTCLEGDILNIEEVGQPLKYMIRFENTGSAEAVNIVVIDTIDTNSFDIRTLEVLNASHQVRTEVYGNEVRFVFNDIYLPFNDASNDGYVTFRIQTLPALPIGHKIENRAGIYFDFNFPIITNTTSTQVSEITFLKDLLAQKLQVSYFPNPSNNKITVESVDNIERAVLSTINGMVVKSLRPSSVNGTFSIDVSDVPPGIYILNLHAGNQRHMGKLVVH